MPKFKAPKHVTGIFTPAGNEYRADENGVAELPDDAPASDFQALAANGWVKIDDAKKAVDQPDPPAVEPKK